MVIGVETSSLSEVLQLEPLLPTPLTIPRRGDWSLTGEAGKSLSSLHSLASRSPCGPLCAHFQMKLTPSAGEGGKVGDEGDGRSAAVGTPSCSLSLPPSPQAPSSSEFAGNDPAAAPWDWRCGPLSWPAPPGSTFRRAPASAAERALVLSHKASWPFTPIGSGWTRSEGVGGSPAASPPPRHRESSPRPAPPKSTFRKLERRCRMSACSSSAWMPFTWPAVERSLCVREGAR